MNQAWQIADFLEIKKNQLHIGGVSALELAGKYGTPLFVYSENRIRHNVERLRAAEKSIGCPLKICYAAKAISNMRILRAVKDAGADLEINSGGELWKALEIGFAPEQIIFNGTSKEIWEIELAINAGIYAIQADSVYELQLIEETARRLGKRANVSLRLVPEIEPETLHGLQTALLTSKFGMMPDEAFAAFNEFSNSEYLNLCGIHLHIGSQTPHPEHYSKALLTLFECFRKIYESSGTKLTHLNLGGGFPVNYLRDSSQTKDFAAHQQELFAAAFTPADALKAAWETIAATADDTDITELFQNVKLLLEPGRSIIGDSAICLTNVCNFKQRPLKQSAVGEKSKTQNPKSKIQNDHWLLTDAGFNILLSMETYKWYYQLISATRAGDAHDFPYKVAGPLCDGGDVYFDIDGEKRLPDYRLLPKAVAPGELLALLNCGAYSVAQMFQYNGRFLPAIALINKDGQAELIRRRDTFADLITNDIY